MATFGFARIANEGSVQLYIDNAVVAAQIGFVLGKLLPMECDVWVDTQVPETPPEGFFRLEITPENADSAEDREDLPNRTRGWFPVIQPVVIEYYNQFAPDHVFEGTLEAAVVAAGEVPVDTGEQTDEASQPDEPTEEE